MKILLDTTYLLPTISIAIEEISQDAVEKLSLKGHEIAISEITLFELSAKGAKYVCNGRLQPEQVTRGIRAILRDQTIEKIPIHESKTLLSAFKVRRSLHDFVDCLILSTAINNCDALITEDHEIQAIKKNEEFCTLLSARNPNFEIKRITEM